MTMPLFGRLTFFMLFLIALGACAGKPIAEPDQPVFVHDFKNAVVPWTHTDFDNEEGKFTFAIFSDLTGGERNGVFDVAVEQLRLLRPELIVNVGDLIEGGDVGREQLNLQWDTFDERANLRLSGIFDKTGKVPFNVDEFSLRLV